MEVNKTDRRVQRTRRAIRDALMELMLDKSYEKITIQEIIDRANVGRATFYNHYQDKDDLLLRGVAEVVNRQDESDPIPHTPQQTAVYPVPDTIVTTGMFKHSRQNSRLHQVMFKRSRENPILEKVTRFLYVHVEELLQAFGSEEHPPTVPIPVMAQFITGGLLSLINWWHDRNFPYTAEEMDEFFQQIAMPGIFEVLGRGEESDDEEL